MVEKLDTLLVVLKDLTWAALKAAAMFDLTALLMVGKTVATMVDLKAELWVCTLAE